MGNPWDGIVLIDKNEGETSHDVVDQIRRILGIKKVGHAGTLDSFATGLLLVLLGQGTKLSPYLMSGEKKYQATMRLGTETDTLDHYGQIVHTKPVGNLTRKDILSQAREFIGEIEQTPPAFSAVKWKGKRAYHLARKGVYPPLKSRRVLIRSLEVKQVNLPNVTFEVACSSGTYIRSLAASLGSRLGTGGHLISLRRLSSGPFAVRHALNLNVPVPSPDRSLLQNRILSLSAALPQMQAMQLHDQLAHRIRNGHKPDWKELQTGSDSPVLCEGYGKLLKGNELVAIFELKSSRGEFSLNIRRVFH